MTKIKMMEKMAKRIEELEYMETHLHDQVKLKYLNATGLHAGGTATTELVKTAVARLRMTGLYSENTKFDIEYFAEAVHEYFAKELEMKAMFEALFGISIYAYRNHVSQETA